MTIGGVIIFKNSTIKKEVFGMLNKKGEKSLNMIFGLFILLIISLVVLSLFFKFTEKSAGVMKGTQEEFFSKQEIQKAENECEVLCSEINDVDSALEFCRKFQKIDFDGDKSVSTLTPASKGRWMFCEDRIPCFILTNCVLEPAVYDGTKCRGILKEYRPDYYAQLEYQAKEATCGLPAGNDTATSPNWVYRFGYYVGAT